MHCSAKYSEGNGERRMRQEVKSILAILGILAVLAILLFYYSTVGRGKNKSGDRIDRIKIYILPYLYKSISYRLSTLE